MLPKSVSTQILTGAQYLSLPRAPETWLLEPLLPAGGAMSIFGDAKVGKSYAALQLAEGIVQGSEWLGFPVRYQGPVVYIQLDTPRSLWASRLDELVHSGLRVDLVHQADRETLGAYPFDILKTAENGRRPHLEIVREALSSLPVPPVAVIVDTIRESHQGKENDSDDMQRVISGWVAACGEAAVIFISHSRKPSHDAAPSTINDMRGSNYVPGRMDAICRLTSKHLYVTGRAIEHGSIDISRMDNNCWEVAGLEDQRIVAAVFEDPTYPTQRAKARQLASRLNQSEESCRSILRRFSMHHKGVGQGEDDPVK